MMHAILLNTLEFIIIFIINTYMHSIVIVCNKILKKKYEHFFIVSVGQLERVNIPITMSMFTVLVLTQNIRKPFYLSSLGSK